MQWKTKLLIAMVNTGVKAVKWSVNNKKCNLFEKIAEINKSHLFSKEGWSLAIFLSEIQKKKFKLDAKVRWSKILFILSMYAMHRENEDTVSI